MYNNRSGSTSWKIPCGNLGKSHRWRPLSKTMWTSLLGRHSLSEDGACLSWISGWLALWSGDFTFRVKPLLHSVKNVYLVTIARKAMDSGLLLLHLDYFNQSLHKIHCPTSCHHWRKGSPDHSHSTPVHRPRISGWLFFSVGLTPSLCFLSLSVSLSVSFSLPTWFLLMISISIIV